MKVLITGGTKGIGYAICEAFLRQGAQLITCARTQADLDALPARLGATPEQVQTFNADLAVATDVAALAAFVRDRWSSLDVLVNNAGIFTPGAVLEEDAQQLDRMLDVNLKSAYLLTRATIELLYRASKGHIFNICSIASIAAYPNGGSYTVSKFALLGLTKVLREELKPKGVRVTAVLPGATWSDSWKGVDLPHARLSESTDIASMILAAYQLGPGAVVEELLIRPQLGDL